MTDPGLHQDTTSNILGTEPAQPAMFRSPRRARPTVTHRFRVHRLDAHQVRPTMQTLDPRTGELRDVLANHTRVPPPRQTWPKPVTVLWTQGADPYDVTAIKYSPWEQITVYAPELEGDP